MGLAFFCLEGQCLFYLSRGMLAPPWHCAFTVPDAASRQAIARACGAPGNVTPAATWVKPVLARNQKALEQLVHDTIAKHDPYLACTLTYFYRQGDDGPPAFGGIQDGGNEVPPGAPELKLKMHAYVAESLGSPEICDDLKAIMDADMACSVDDERAMARRQTARVMGVIANLVGEA